MFYYCVSAETPLILLRFQNEPQNAIPRTEKHIDVKFLPQKNVILPLFARICDITARIGFFCGLKSAFSPNLG